MSKYPTKKRKSKEQEGRERELRVLEDILKCSTCENLGRVRVNKPDYTVAEIDEFLEQLPGADYVMKRMINYIFSNGLTTGQEADDTNKLDPWLYETKNRLGQTNYEVLKAAIAHAAWYGECGLRMYDGNIYFYKKGMYGMLTGSEDGIEEVMAYFIRKDGKAIEGDLDEADWDHLNGFFEIEDYFDANGYILLDTSKFVNIRNDVSKEHGVSPLSRDQQRLNLLMSVYERLNYDIDYDGPGRIILRPRDRVEEISTGELMDNSIEKRTKEMKQEAKRIAKEIANSTSDAAIVLSNGFDENITHLPRVTKATEFLTWLEGDTVVIAQMLGMSPTLLEVGKLHGNVSVEKIIDNAMLNTIIPIREGYAVQFSKLIADELKVGKVYFDKYDLEQVQDENEMRERVANIVQKLSVANKNSPSENTERLVDEFDDFLRTSIYDDNNNARSL